MLISALAKEKKETFDKGKLKGIAEGKVKGVAEGKIKGVAEGKLKGKIEIAKAMLSEGLSIPLISKLTGISEKEILKLQFRSKSR